MAQLLVAEFLFTLKLRKRPLFWLRYIALVAVCMTIAIFVPVQPQNALGLSAVFLGLFAVTFLLHLLCFDVPALNIIFCLIVAYSIQHFAYCLSNCMLIITGLSENVYGVYSQQVMEHQLPAAFVFGLIFEFVIYYVTYYVYYLFFGDRIKRNTEMKLQKSLLLIVGAVAIILSIFVNSLVVFSELGDSLVVSINLYNALCCGFIIYMLFGMLTNVKMKDELDVVYKILRESQDQYEISKKNIENINIKCHDLKHQIRQIGRAKLINDDAIREITDVVSIYDSEMETGNVVLDTILTEKGLYCYRNKIQLTCMADGHLLDFMNEAELYSLFGNALDNAIAAVHKIADHEKHCIGLTVSRVKDFIAINIYNFYEGVLKYSERGLPFTTKKDAANHGFGMKSIYYIVEKYGGKVSVNAENGVFNLNIVFPIEKREEAS